MPNKRNLAIVIPAYKSTFLPAALDSIAAQSCQEFTLYIGDDCSPNNIGEIVDRYRDKINLVYKRFETNLGGKDLVAQWERCIDMTQDEEWLWLFSDDDVMEEKCVEEFYNSLDEKTEFYHFNLKICDEEGNVTKIPPLYPNIIDTKYFIEKHLFKGLTNAVVEFIFSRNLYLKAGKFQNYDLAWGSDFITWVKFSVCNGNITTIPCCYVYWRLSSQNISPQNSHDIIIRKLRSIVENYKTLRSIFHNINMNYSFKYDLIIFKQLYRNKHIISKNDGDELLYYYYRLQKYKIRYWLFRLMWIFAKIK